jgi:hypothetical protein
MNNTMLNSATVCLKGWQNSQGMAKRLGEPSQNQKPGFKTGAKKT